MSNPYLNGGHDGPFGQTRAQKARRGSFHEGDLDEAPTEELEHFRSDSPQRQPKEETWNSSVNSNRNGPLGQTRARKARRGSFHEGGLNEVPAESDLVFPKRRPTVATPATPNRGTWFSEVISWIFEVLGMSLNHLKIPISIIIALVFVYLGWRVVGALVLRSTCSLPVLSYLSICKFPQRDPPDIKKIFATQANLADVQQETTSRRTLPGEIKTGQLAMRDIEIAISVSNIEGKGILGIFKGGLTHRLREEIRAHINDFLELGQTAITKLLQHQADVNRVVDATLGLNHWAERSLQDIATIDASPISRSINAVMAYLPGAPATRKSVQNIYLYYTKELSEELTGTIKNGQDVLWYLTELENKLVTSAKLLGHGKKSESDKLKDLDTFWAMIFQMHREELKSVKKQMGLIGGLQSDIDVARKSVQQTDLKFKTMNVEVESLKKALADPAIKWKDDESQIEFYLAGIRGVIDRLETGKQAADRARRIGG